MLKAKKVSRAVIVGNKRFLGRTIEILHDNNCVHIEDFSVEDSFLSIGKPEEAASTASQKLIKLRSLSNFLGIKPKYPDVRQDERNVLQELDERLGALDFRVSELLQRRNLLETELKNLEVSEAELQPLTHFPINVEMYSGYESISVFQGYVQGSPNEIETALRHASANCEFTLVPYNKTHLIALFVPVKDTENVIKTLTDHNYSEIKIPALKGNPEKLVAGMENRKQDVQLELQSLYNEIDGMRAEHMDFILASDEILSITTQKAEAPLRFATSENTFIIDCWIPDEQSDDLARTIDEQSKGSVFLSKLEMNESESSTIPVEYDNPKIVKPLETIMDLYSRPLYKEIDPSVLIFITFPLFYGLMLGDVGYGLVLLALGMAGRAKVKSPGLKSLATLLMYCSITTLIFGVLFAEVFGFHMFGSHSIIAELLGEHSAIGEIFYNFHALPILNRLGKEDIPILLIATALIGVVHLNIGFIIGFRNEARSHGMRTAVLEKLSWMVLQLGIAIYALAALKYIPGAGQTAGAAVAVLGVAMLIAGEGGTAVLELPSILSNTLSYTRLAAVGLSSVGIAFAINNIVTEILFPKGGLFILVGILVLLIGHAVNTVLGVIAPGLHSLRLQYVEFFTKFYHGGGRKFNPFGYNRKYTEVK